MTPEKHRRETRVSIREKVLTVAAFVFIAGYTGLVLQPSPEIVTISWGILGLVWALFIANFAIQLFRERMPFLRRSWWQVFIIFIPMLAALYSIRAIRHLAYFKRVTPESVRRRFFLQFVLGVVMFVYVSSLAAFRFEHLAAGATIDSWGNSIWWTIVTMATVGYGDFTPVTLGGRFVAVANMVVGIGVIGVTSATVVNYLTQITSHKQNQHKNIESS